MCGSVHSPNSVLIPDKRSLVYDPGRGHHGASDGDVLETLITGFNPQRMGVTNAVQVDYNCGRHATNSAGVSVHRLRRFRHMTDVDAFVFCNYLRPQQQQRCSYFHAKQHDDGRGKRAVHHTHLR